MKLSKRLRPLLKHKEHITYLTSLLYPIDALEVFQVACCMDSTKPTTISTVLNQTQLNDAFAASASIAGAVMRDALNTCVMAPDNVAASARLGQVVLKDLLNGTSADKEGVKATAAIDRAVLTNALINNNAQTEPVTAMAAIDKATLG